MNLESSSQHRDERGATAVEYGLMVGLIAIVIIAAVILFGDALAASFQDDCTQIFGSC